MRQDRPSAEARAVDNCSQRAILKVQKVAMTIRELVQVLSGEVVSGEDKLDKSVEDFAAADLLSDVLAIEKENYALMTGLTNAQIVRTAEITNACCVVIVRNKQPKRPAITLARRVLDKVLLVI